MKDPIENAPLQHEEPGASDERQRLQKIIAAAGVASRRKAEELILGGRVQINGKTVTELGTKADPARDHIRVDGKLLQGPERPRYVVLNKPKGYVTTASDPEGRPTVMNLVKGGERLFPVGRLDYSSEGLLLMTNDGDLANALTRAAARVEKTYLVKVSGKPSESALNQLRQGVMIDRGSQIRPESKPGRRPQAEQPRHNEGRVMTAPARIRLLREGENPWYEMILIEGRNREIRKMFEEIGHHVEKIRRVGYGPLVLDLEPGRSRDLSLEEIAALRRAAEGKTSRAARGKQVRDSNPSDQRRRPTTRGASASAPSGAKRNRVRRPRSGNR
ncbi:MAG: pseudouridine synthase [Acidobacteriota bacterium]